MDSSFKNGILVGAVAGAAAMGIGVLLLMPPSRTVELPLALPVSVPTDLDTQLREENRKLAKQVQELEKVAARATTTPAADPKPDPQPASTVAVKDLFVQLAESGLAGVRGPKFGELLDAVKKEGRPAIDFLTNVLKTSTSATERFFAGALLEGAGDASAIPGLALALQNDKDDLVRRMASHAIAVLGTPAAEAPLRLATAGDPDWGVRVNSAYGLAKLKHDDGLKMLRDAYESPDTPAEYRMAVLGGLADVAAPSTAPLFRKILTDTKDVSYLLASIMALEKMKDAEAVPALQQLSTNAPSDIVKQAAARAVDAIRK